MLLGQSYKSLRVQLTISLACCLTVFGQESVVLHQAQLQQRLRLQELGAVGCTRLLHSSGKVGCAASETDALLTQLDHPRQAVQQESVVVLTERLLNPFLQQLQGNETLQSLIKGILLSSSELPEAESPASKFPQAEFAPYQSSFAWNPPGTSLDHAALPFPVLLLDGDTAVQAVAKAAYNKDKGYRGSLHHVKVATAMSAEHNSSFCIQQQTCQPLGGHSIWAAAPPLPAPRDRYLDDKPLVMLLAPVDSTAFFKSKTVGAESAVGSLIALMAVADILGNNTAAVATYSKRLVLTALVGEPWGFMGSKRLLWEMHTHSESTVGLAMDNIQQVVEIGQVGQASSSRHANFTFYSHQQQGDPFGDAAPVVKALQDAASSSAGLQLNAEVQLADDSNPGIPPGSFSSFLRVKPSIQGAVLADHGAAYRNAFYQSHLDTVDKIEPESLGAAAAIIAKAVHALASSPATPSLQVDQDKVQLTINALLDCLLRDKPGLQCPWGQSLLGTGTAAVVEHYVGVLRTLTNSSQDPSPVVKTNVERFIWNFLALRLSQGKVTSETGPGAGCDAYSHKCLPGASCIASVPGQGPSYCVNASVSYVPSYSTHLSCQGCDINSIYQWQESNASAAWEAEHDWPPDLMWTESNWPSGQPYLELYQKESAAASKGAVIAGLLVVAMSIIALIALSMYTPPPATFSNDL